MIGGFFAVGLVAWTYDYDTAYPSGADSPTILDDSDREIKAALQERLDVDHYFPLTGTEVNDANAGKHERVTFFRSGSADCNLHTEDYCDTGELFWTDPCGTNVMLTYDGNLYVPDDLIEPNMLQDDFAFEQFPTSPNAAPDADLELANKKYVDDNVDISGRLYEAGGSQAITAGGGWTVITLDTEDTDFTGATMTTGASAKITIPADANGLYEIKGHIFFEPVADNKRHTFVGIRLNGATIIAGGRDYRDWNGDALPLGCSTMDKLVGTDYVELVAKVILNNTTTGNDTMYGPISELIVQKVRDL